MRNLRSSDPGRDEHAVAGVDFGMESQLRRNGRVGDQRVREGQGSEVGELVLECFGYERGFAAGEGANSVDEFAAGLYGCGGMREKFGLQRAEFVDVLQRSRPAGMRVALPGSDAAAWSVQEDAVEFGFDRQFRAAVPKASAIIEEAGAGGPTFESLQTPLGTVAGPDQAFVVHEIAKMKGF